MRNSMKLILAVAIVIGLSGCFGRTQAIYNVSSEPVSVADAHKVTAAQVADVIKACLIKHAWSIEKADSGSYRATISWRGHSATVDIAFDNKSYDIILVSSANLLQKDGKIHRNYNKRIHQLEQDINLALAKL